MFWARVWERPETRLSRATEAVFTSTPTAFTQSSTTASSAGQLALADVVLVLADPMLLGSILTSSARGSCSRRAMETAPRMETSRSGNSWEASSEAE